MSKPQLLALDPANELQFNGPFTEVVPSQMTLTNLTDRTVNFKIKTTAPRFYCVRPNSGQVHGGQSVKVSVMLQPVDSVQTLEKERSRHKFMVQSALATEVDSVETFWKTVDPLDVTDTRLKVVFNNLNAHADNRSGDYQPHDEAFKTLNDSQGAGNEPQLTRRNVPSSQEAPSSRPSTFHSPSGTVQRPGAASSGDKPEDKRLEEENRFLTMQVQELRHKLSQLATNASSIDGFPTIQVILLTLAALLIGIIVGKLF